LEGDIFLQENFWKEEPLALKVRPKNLGDFVGQEHLLSNGMPLRVAIEEDALNSCILYGPPGCGKTSLAEVIKNQTKNEFKHFSAATQGVGILKPMMKAANEFFSKAGQPTVIFVDEIHRFSKSQQDTLLPYVESGAVILIGATTENPSFEVNPALLSRCQVFVFRPLSKENLKVILKKALENSDVKISESSFDEISELSGGDARVALNFLEEAIKIAGLKGLKEIENVGDLIQKSLPRYRKRADEHYNFISALHKSMRGSDPDAAVYYLAAMLEAGEDPLYVARRVVRFASEDVGLADPRALSIAIDAYQATHFIGMPECTTALAEAVMYCAVAAKSNATYCAYKEAAKDVKSHPYEKVPFMLRNAPTKLMKNMGYSKGYVYQHDVKNAFLIENYLPERLKGRVFYHPTIRGLEGRIKEKMEKLWGKFKEWEN